MSRIALALVLAAGLGALSSGCKSGPESADVRSTKSVSLYKEGVQQFNDGRINEGITSLQKGAEAQPDYTLLRMDLGRMLLIRALRADEQSMRNREEAERKKTEGEHEQARSLMDQAVALNRSAMADLRTAQGHLLFAEAKWPHEANIPLFLSQVAFGLGDFGEARAHLKRAIELGQPEGPQRERFEKMLALLDKAELQARRRGDWEGR